MDLNAAKREGRTLRTTKSMLRFARNVLAVLGVCFVYLLVTGYMQYEDRLASGDVTCSLTHCA